MEDGADDSTSRIHLLHRTRSTSTPLGWQLISMSVADIYLPYTAILLSTTQAEELRIASSTLARELDAAAARVKRMKKQCEAAATAEARVRCSVLVAKVLGLGGTVIVSNEMRLKFARVAQVEAQHTCDRMVNGTPFGMSFSDSCQS